MALLTSSALVTASARIRRTASPSLHCSTWSTTWIGTSWRRCSRASRPSWRRVISSLDSCQTRSSSRMSQRRPCSAVSAIRGSRPRLLFSAGAFWSLATAGAGLARNFAQLVASASRRRCRRSGVHDHRSFSVGGLLSSRATRPHVRDLLYGHPRGRGHRLPPGRTARAAIRMAWCILRSGPARPDCRVTGADTAGSAAAAD